MQQAVPHSRMEAARVEKLHVTFDKTNSKEAIQGARMKLPLSRMIENCDYKVPACHSTRLNFLIHCPFIFPSELSYLWYSCRFDGLFVHVS